MYITSCAFRLIYFSWSLTWEMKIYFSRLPKGQIRVSISGSVIQIHFTKIYYYLNKWFNQYGKNGVISLDGDENRLNSVKLRETRFLGRKDRISFFHLLEFRVVSSRGWCHTSDLDSILMLEKSQFHQKVLKFFKISKFLSL